MRAEARKGRREGRRKSEPAVSRSRWEERARKKEGDSRRLLWI